LEESELNFVENCCFLERLKKPIMPKEAFLREYYLDTPEKACERAYFTKQKPKIHQSKLDQKAFRLIMYR